MKKTIIEYKTLWASQLAELENEANKLITDIGEIGDQEWEASGGISAIHNQQTDEMRFYQAMVLVQYG